MLLSVLFICFRTTLAAKFYSTGFLIVLKELDAIYP